jgi:tetratricopeptide (TPR) repeat protein
MSLIPHCHELFQAGRYHDVESHCQQIVQTEPNNAEAWDLLGLSQLRLNQLGAAELSFRRAVEIRPERVECHLRLGSALMGQVKFAEAAASYQTAVQLAPNLLEAVLGLGLALLCLGRFGEAASCFHKAIDLKPDQADAHNFLGDALRGQGKWQEALAAYDRAIELRPAFADAHNNRGFTLDELRRADEAVASFDEAIRLRPGFTEAYHNRGVALGKLARYPEAIASFDEAIILVPVYPEARRNRALALLVLGDLERGWQEFEWRWKCRDLTMPKHPEPLWEGEPLEGRTILLHVEQGLGDTIQFIRYAALVSARGGRVVVECQRPLVSLVMTCPGVDQVVTKGEALPPFDVHTPLLRLMGVFKTTLETIPAAIPYLSAKADRVAYWRKKLAHYAGFRIGIAWQGNPRHTRDADRSFALANLEGIARIDGVQLISLQRGHGLEQLSQFAGHFSVIDLGDDVDPGLVTMRDTPAIMKCLDLVITADTSLAHLAGALGVPVWIALPLAPDWRWLTGREDSPWYPTARLFRQTGRGCWGPVFERMESALRERMANKKGRG